MEQISHYFYVITNQLSTIGFADVVDIIVVAFFLYYTFKFMKDRRAGKLALGVILMLLMLLVSDVFQMRATYFILEKIISVGLIALLIVFQPELRSMLEKMGGESVKGFKGRLDKSEAEHYRSVISEICVAAEDLSRTKTGALIVIERSTRLGDVIKTGTVLDAQVSSFLLGNIFFNKAPLHDGAVIIRRGRILGAGCMLPLSKNVNLSRDLGMRHRAGIGMSENSDAVVVIVSEETGSISVAIGGMLKRHLKPETLGKLLRNELMPPEEETEDKPRRNLAELLGLNRKGADDHVGTDL